MATSLTPRLSYQYCTHWPHSQALLSVLYTLASLPGSPISTVRTSLTPRLSYTASKEAWGRLFLCSVNLIRGVAESESFIRPVQAFVIWNCFWECFWIRLCPHCLHFITLLEWSCCAGGKVQIQTYSCCASSDAAHIFHMECFIHA